MVSLVLTTLALGVSPGTTAAQEPPTCAWPFELAAEGLGNSLFPDNNARYPIMRFDDEWREMTITGFYPEARFMSYTIYYWTNFETDEVGDHLYDAQISPDPGSTNPFVSPGGEGGTYTVTVTRDETTEDANVLRVMEESPWVVYRLYLPDMGENSLGGPLPTVTVTDRDGATYPLEPCPRVNDFDDLIQQLPQFFPPDFELPDIPDLSADRLWLYPISPLPAWIGPNPDSKYVGVFGVDLQPGRVVVVRGKAPGFPDTYFGSPIWEPAPGFDDVQLRYWSLCQNDLVLPLPVVECVADLRTQVDEDGFYTYVISDDLFAPEWVPPDATWVPWGAERMPKLIAFRNTLPAADFDHAVQAAIEAGCALPPPFGSAADVPTDEEVEEAGRCAQEVMEEYYPVAAWCDEEVFVEGGWPACFEAAGIPLNDTGASATLEITCEEFSKQNHIDRQVTVGRGGVLSVSLCSNPSTGFSWESPQFSDATVLEQVSHEYIEPLQAVGTPGREIWKFHARESGMTTISFLYSRPWEGGEKGEWGLTLTVIVK